MHHYGPVKVATSCSKISETVQTLRDRLRSRHLSGGVTDPVGLVLTGLLFEDLRILNLQKLSNQTTSYLRTPIINWTTQSLVALPLHLTTLFHYKILSYYNGVCVLCVCVCVCACMCCACMCVCVCMCTCPVHACVYVWSWVCGWGDFEKIVIKGIVFLMTEEFTS